MEYREGIFVGYRYYDTKRIEPLFPFGHGLSYTTFDYSHLTVSSSHLTDAEQLTVTMDVVNTGNRIGKEIIQLYVRELNATIIRPDKELKGFAKVDLQPGQRQTVEFTLDKRSFAYYDVDHKDWRVESGEYEILIGASSRDIRLSQRVAIDSTMRSPMQISRNSTVGDLLANPHTKEAIMSMLQRNNPFASFGEAEEEASGMMEAIMRYLPLRALVSFGGGKFTESDMQTMIDELNRISVEGSVN